MPVITTPHTMGPEIIENDKNGYLIPIRDINAIQHSIEKLLKKLPDEFDEMTLNARKSAESLSWNYYSKNLNTMINSLPK